jgi:hypothetical protein
MKTLLRVSLVLALLPLIASAQAPAPATAPKKETISTFRIWPKAGHEDQLKAAITAHAKKWHTGPWAWRVYEVLTGEDGGAYHIVEGPNSWTDIEGRGDLGAEHTKDFPTNILPHAEKISPESFMTYNSEASTSPAGNFSTKAVITQYYPKPGRISHLLAQLRQVKASAEKDGINVAIWVSAASGDPRVAFVRRLKNGLKDYDDSTATMRATMDAIYGNGAYERHLEELEANVSRITGEMIEYQPALSTR